MVYYRNAYTLVLPKRSTISSLFDYMRVASKRFSVIHELGYKRYDTKIKAFIHEGYTERWLPIFGCTKRVLLNATATGCFVSKRSFLTFQRRHKARAHSAQIRRMSEPLYGRLAHNFPLYHVAVLIGKSAGLQDNQFSPRRSFGILFSLSRTLEHGSFALLDEKLFRTRPYVGFS